MKKQGERTFLENTYRFFQPLWYAPYVTIKTMVKYLLYSIEPIVHIIFIQKLVHVIEAHDKEGFMMVALYYGGFILLYEL